MAQANGKKKHLFLILFFFFEHKTFILDSDIVLWFLFLMLLEHYIKKKFSKHRPYAYLSLSGSDDLFYDNYEILFATTADRNSKVWSCNLQAEKKTENKYGVFDSCRE